MPAFINKGKVAAAGNYPEAGPGLNRLTQGGEEIFAPGMFHGAGDQTLFTADTFFRNHNNRLHGMVTSAPSICPGEWELLMVKN
jgi:hypothetical protein